MSNVAILGRGTSLERYPEFAHLLPKVYLVNPFAEEIDKLGPEHFKGKELVHVVSKCADCRLRPDQYELFTNIVTTANTTKRDRRIAFPVDYPNFQPMPACMQDRGFPLVEWSSVAMITQGLPRLPHKAVIETLEEHLFESIASRSRAARVSTRCWPTTGIFAIDLALMTEKPTVAWLFGFDCFQRGVSSYFVANKKSYQSEFAQEVMRYYLRKLVMEFSTITFRSADEQPSIKEENWELIT